MLSFASDYLEGAHPALMERLLQSNMEQLSGYGTDGYCERAKEKIRKACQAPQAEVFFLAGGTQTNQLAIDTLLTFGEGVIAAESGHVAAHEAGAIEATGHKVLTLPSHEGKLLAWEVDAYIRRFYADENCEHMVAPGMVYLSHPTEYGTLYTLRELQDISNVCRTHGIPLYMDGARLGYGLAATGTDLTLPQVARLCDAFYIGGTKLGALCGEALVLSASVCPPRMVAQIKRHGALLAKGRLLGVQFDALFSNGLYEQIGTHAIRMAERMKEIFLRYGYTFYLESPTNQQFLVLENGQMEVLSHRVAFCFWEKADETHTVVRFATSWATTEAQLVELEKILQDMERAK